MFTGGHELDIMALRAGMGGMGGAVCVCVAVCVHVHVCVLVDTCRIIYSPLPRLTMARPEELHIPPCVAAEHDLRNAQMVWLKWWCG